jgi:hypothetical protein
MSWARRTPIDMPEWTRKSPRGPNTAQRATDNQGMLLKAGETVLHEKEHTSWLSSANAHPLAIQCKCSVPGYPMQVLSAWLSNASAQCLLSNASAQCLVIQCKCSPTGYPMQVFSAWLSNASAQCLVIQCKCLVPGYPMQMLSPEDKHMARNIVQSKWFIHLGTYVCIQHMNVHAITIKRIWKREEGVGRAWETKDKGKTM